MVPTETRQQPERIPQRCVGAAGASPGHLQDAPEQVEDRYSPQETVVGPHDERARPLQLAQAGFEPPCLQDNADNSH